MLAARKIMEAHMLWIIFKLFLAVIALLLVYAWFKPDQFRLERSAFVNAAPEKIYSQVANFHNWQAWSPWEGLDPDLKRTYAGADEGLGAIYSWEGNKKVGAGRMELTEANPKTGVSLKLDFFRPFKANNLTDISFTPEGSGTRVNWAMYGPQPFAGRLMTTFVSMDKMVGGDFERGLAKLKAVSES
jgi:Polyketide cyclase / dehydrase and lipid transport